MIPDEIQDVDSLFSGRQPHTSTQLLLENIYARVALLLNMGRRTEAERLCVEGLDLCGTRLGGDQPGDTCALLQELQETHFGSAGG